jgi:hypothetical protein
MPPQGKTLPRVRAQSHTSRSQNPIRNCPSLALSGGLIETQKETPAFGTAPSIPTSHMRTEVTGWADVQVMLLHSLSPLGLASISWDIHTRLSRFYKAASPSCFLPLLQPFLLDPTWISTTPMVFGLGNSPPSLEGGHWPAWWVSHLSFPRLTHARADHSQGRMPERYNGRELTNGCSYSLTLFGSWIPGILLQELEPDWEKTKKQKANAEPRNKGFLGAQLSSGNTPPSWPARWGFLRDKTR